MNFMKNYIKFSPYTINKNIILFISFSYFIEFNLSINKGRYTLKSN